MWMSKKVKRQVVESNKEKLDDLQEQQLEAMQRQEDIIDGVIDTLLENSKKRNGKVKTFTPERTKLTPAGS